MPEIIDGQPFRYKITENRVVRKIADVARNLTRPRTIMTGLAASSLLLMPMKGCAGGQPSTSSGAWCGERSLSPPDLKGFRRAPLPLSPAELVKQTGDYQGESVTVENPKYLTVSGSPKPVNVYIGKNIMRSLCGYEGSIRVSRRDPASLSLVVPLNEIGQVKAYIDSIRSIKGIVTPAGLGGLTLVVTGIQKKP